MKKLLIVLLFSVFGCVNVSSEYSDIYKDLSSRYVKYEITDIHSRIISDPDYFNDSIFNISKNKILTTEVITKIHNDKYFRYKSEKDTIIEKIEHTYNKLILKQDSIKYVWVNYIIIEGNNKVQKTSSYHYTNYGCINVDNNYPLGKLYYKIRSCLDSVMNKNIN